MAPWCCPSLLAGIPRVLGGMSGPVSPAISVTEVRLVLPMGSSRYTMADDIVLVSGRRRGLPEDSLRRSSE